MSYMRANTDNPNGWRPGTVRTLGELRRLSHPDWKASAAAMDHAQRMQHIHAAAARHAHMIRLTRDDAFARGVHAPVRLSGLGTLDPGSTMVIGGNYVFQFNVSCGLFGVCVGLATSDIVSALKSDSNFRNVTPTPAPGGGYLISFVYSGQGSIVLNAGMEMAKVLSDNISNASFTFVSASGPATDAPVSPGLVYSDQAPSGSSNPPFDISSLFSGLGVGTVGGIALTIGAIVLIKNL
ncbi:MAG: hypothetical protein LAO20_14365 [Acidobacteriia bacterium]|nr:hypothetical protein [Terriglobia bacterium]